MSEEEFEYTSSERIERTETGVVEAEELEKKLEELMNTMKDWERRPIVKVGRAIVELVKLPRRESSKKVEPERLAIHVRLEDSFRGIFIVESSDLQDIIEALRNKTVNDVARAIDSINRRRRVVEYGI